VSTQSTDRRGVVRRQVRDMGRNITPGFRLPECQQDESIAREAYQLALANCHKPWARRYLRARMLT
jgi:hypothetical protein